MTLLGFGVKKGHQTKNEMPFKNIMKIKIIDRGEGGYKGFSSTAQCNILETQQIGSEFKWVEKKGFQKTLIGANCLDWKEDFMKN